MHSRSRESASIRVGRYVIHPAIAHGGMATVYPAHLVGEGGFTRLVAVKRLHPALVSDPEVVSMFHDEARIASQIHHPGVVPVLDVVAAEDEVILVQEYVHGVPLGFLLRRAVGRGEPIPLAMSVAMVAGLLLALHATHEAKDERGEPLNVIHRDVSANNVMITVDGGVRLLDFGIAKARSSPHRTRVGVFKGKLVYMAPELLRSEPVTRRADVYAVGVILWQLLVNRRFYTRPDEFAFVRAVTHAPPPSMLEAIREGRRFVPDERRRQITRLSPVVERALASDPKARFATAHEMLDALVAVTRPASAAELARWVAAFGAEHLESRREALRLVDPSEAETLVAKPVEVKALLTPPAVSASIMPVASPIAPRRTVLDRVAPLVAWAGLALSLLFVGILGGIAKESLAPRPSPAAAPPSAEEIAPPPVPDAPSASAAPSASSSAEPEPAPPEGRRRVRHRRGR